jgi:hypothetical protein
MMDSSFEFKGLDVFCLTADDLFGALLSHILF